MVGATPALDALGLRTLQPCDAVTAHEAAGLVHRVTRVDARDREKLVDVEHGFPRYGW